MRYATRPAAPTCGWKSVPWKLRQRSRCEIVGRALLPKTCRTSLTATIRRPIPGGWAWAWRSPATWWRPTGAKFKRKVSLAGEQPSDSRSRRDSLVKLALVVFGPSWRLLSRTPLSIAWPPNRQSVYQNLKTTEGESLRWFVFVYVVLV